MNYTFIMEYKHFLDTIITVISYASANLLQTRFYNNNSILWQESCIMFMLKSHIF